MNPWRATLRGMVAMTCAASAFTINDGLSKLADLPAGETMAIRSAFAGLLLATVIVANGLARDLPHVFNRAVVVRTLADVAATILYLLALFQIPLSNALTIVQVTPLAITAAAALFLGEHVGWHRWTAVLAGFLGVLIVVRPGLSGFQAASLLTILSVVFITARDLATRAMPPISGLVIGFAAMAANTLVGLGLGAVEAWRVPSPAAFAEILGAAIALALGQICIIIAMRSGDMSAVAPFRYVAIPLSIVLGFLFWRDVPDVVMLIGTGLIIAAGLYTFARERSLARRGGHKTAHPSVGDAGLLP
jgi:drug/metabolite transporter (DMT)-like permease